MATRKFEDVTKEVDASEGTSVHLLPFKIEYEGAANVQTLFNETSLPHPDFDNSCSDSKVLINRFRGRPLTGKKMDVPSDYEGVVLTDLKQSIGQKVAESLLNGGTEPSATDDDTSTVRIIKRFNSMTYWNWDKTPSTMDAPVKLLDWLQLSQVLHEPIVPCCSR